MIEFTYKGYLRIAEPHIYGMRKGKRYLLVYQVGGGTSSGRLPDWRLVGIDEIVGLKVMTGQKFASRQDVQSSTYNTDWDTIITSAEQ